jgi:hypothetical protein
MQMGFAAVGHVYVLPAKPYQLMGPQKRGSVSVLSDYAAIDMPPDPEEVKDLERPTVRRLPYAEIAEGTSLKESMHDLVFKGSEYVKVLSSLCYYHICFSKFKAYVSNGNLLFVQEQFLTDCMSHFSI